MIDGTTGGHLWAERYDRDIEDVFAVQDEVTRTIVDALKVKLTAGEEARRVHRGKIDPQAYDLIVRSRQTVLQLRPEAAVEARRMLERGLLEEVRGLLARFGDPPPRPLAAIGYRQAVAVLRGALSPAAAERETVTETMRFAKRQMTWFRHQAEGVRWFEDPEAAHDFAAGWLGSAERSPA